MKTSKLFRAISYATAALGAVGIVITDRLFACRVKEYITSSGEVPMAKENFTLFLRLSLGLAALLMALQLLTLTVDVLGGQRKKGFAGILSGIYAPVSMAVLIALAVFFAYLSADSLFPVHGYIIALGICEAAVFCLPVALRSLADEKMALRKRDTNEKTKG